MDILLRDRTVTLEPGEMFVVPKGIEHCPVAHGEVQSPVNRTYRHTQHGRQDNRRAEEDRMINSIDDTLTLLNSEGYVAGRDLATVVFLALRMGRPLFLEGEAGVGKTEIAKVLADALGRKLIRLQCYEGLDINSAVYEWNYSAQMIEIRLAEASGAIDRARLSSDIFAERFLIKRPLLQALDAPKGAGAGAADRRTGPHRRSVRGLPA